MSLLDVAVLLSGLLFIALRLHTLRKPSKTNLHIAVWFGVVHTLISTLKVLLE